MTYKEETERWIDELFAKLAHEPMQTDEVKVAIRERILQSFKNGLKAKPREKKLLASQQSTERV